MSSHWQEVSALGEQISHRTEKSIQGYVKDFKDGSRLRTSRSWQGPKGQLKKLPPSPEDNWNRVKTRDHVRRTSHHWSLNRKKDSAHSPLTSEHKFGRLSLVGTYLKVQVVTWERKDAV